MKIIALLFSILLSLPATAENKEFKCLLETSAGEQISFYKWDEQKVQQKMASLLAKQIVTANTIKKTFVKEVVECVPLDSGFKSTRANELDKATLR